MRGYMSESIAFLMCCVGIWFFADTLWWAGDQGELIERNVLKETSITVGVNEPCKVNIMLSAWNDMNQLEIYRWVIACEDSQ